MSTDSVINFVDAVAVYNGYPALAGVTLSVSRNEIVLLQGPNGAGKSTLLGLIDESLHPTSGRVKTGKTVKLRRLDQRLEGLERLARSGKTLHLRLELPRMRL